MILGSAAGLWASAPPVLSTLRAISALSNDQVSQHLPVAFEATVTYYRGYESTLFVQEGDDAIFVQAPPDANLVAGDRVLVLGTTQGSFRPSIYGREIRFLRHGAIPRPTPASYDALILGKFDCKLVSVRATVRAVNLERHSNLHRAGNPLVTSTRMRLLTENGYIEAFIDSGVAAANEKLLGAEVEITGVAGGIFDGKMRQTGILLHVPSLASVKFIRGVSADVHSLPISPMDRILTGYRVRDLTQRVRVRGTITYYEPGSAVVLQSGPTSLWIATRNTETLTINDLADATGFPDARNGFLTLTDGEVWDDQVPARLAPQPSSWKDLAASSHPFDLVSAEATVVRQSREVARDEYVLISDGHLFSAIYHHPNTLSNPDVPPMKEVPAGSKVRITGICILEDSNPFDSQVPFEILMRSFDDIEVVTQPPWLNVRHLVILVGLLLVAFFVTGARAWYFERKVRRQTVAVAYLEKRRGRILEDINGSRPLAELIEQITEVVSFRLHGSPCWCEIADGARLGNWPANPSALRVVQNPIPSRSGPPLGTIFAAFALRARPTPEESEALSMGASLAALAIETRRLYSDLLHRSEFDLLTDIENRFSLEKHLELFIDEARLTAGIFGLIYIDLDDFKHVNDQYGHQVGDLYLQEAASRMKRQLRPGDILARLGGDEFAVLVPAVKNRAAVQEIALRLERCFDEPFALESLVLHGSASVGTAFYPEDATTRDALLSFADTAMYARKHSGKGNPIAPAGQPDIEFAIQDRN
jgi:diguanylate cyclase (GGDEF)-like protein